MIEDSILSSTAGAVRTLTLHRPAALNSFTAAMHRELLAALNQAADDPSVRALVLTGAGHAFCAGQDLSDPAIAPNQDLGLVIERHYKPLVARLRSMPVPLVAAVNGVAAGAGANLALNCDLVLAAQSAHFIQSFSRLGLVPDTGGTWLLPRLVGRARALGLMMTAEKLAAADAERIGLIWRCVADDALATEAQSLALKLAAMPTRALVHVRHALDDAQGLAIEQALEAEAQRQRELGFAHDYQEGVSAFLAKRSAHYTDR
jgi:2-(1,2-epoxy-1,2-dihydrophenyl)acetyl-CoA isomerase